MNVFSKNSQTIVFCVKTRENLTRGFEFFLKIDENNAFLLFSKEIFENFLKNVPNNCFFVKTRENLTQGFELILKIDQNNSFIAIL